MTRSSLSRSPSKRAATLGALMLTLAGAALLAGCGGGKETPAPPAAKPGEIRVVADNKGFSPSAVTLKKGGDGSVTFVRTVDNTCATEVEFPDLKLKKELPLNQPVVISIPTTEARSYSFACGMGMYKSTVTVQ